MQPPADDKAATETAQPTEDGAPRARRSGRVRWVLAILAFAFAGMVLLALAHPFWLTRLAAFLLVNEPPVRSDVIFVLDGGDERVLHGVKLYQAGHAPRIWFSLGPGEAPDVFDLRSVRVARALEHIRRQGVTEDRMTVEGRARSTNDEATLAKDFAAREGCQSAIVVSSPFHMRRVAMIFRRVFRGSGVRLTFCGVPLEDEDLSLDRWWTREREMIWVNNEYCKLALYCFKYGL